MMVNKPRRSSRIPAPLRSHPDGRVMPTASGPAKVTKEFGAKAGSLIVMGFSGKAVDPLNLAQEDIVVEDIAFHLANQCRFSGGTGKQNGVGRVPVHYSVAEHSVRVTRWVKERGGSTEDQQWATIHDASEAFLSDLARPVKQDPDFAKFRRAERHLEKVLCERFGLDDTMPAIVKDGDVAVFAAERRDLMPDCWLWDLWSAPPNLDVPQEEIKPWTAQLSFKNYLKLFHRLFGRDA